MTELPGGTVTLLFTDVAQSTELVKRLREHYADALATHQALLRTAFAEHGGVEIDTQGDAFFVVFRRTGDAVKAAADAQRALAKQTWPDDVAVAIRVGMHNGEPHRAQHGYTGLAVHRAARICTLANGGQVLLSGATAGIVEDEQIAGISLRDLGEYRLKDFDRPERIVQLVIQGLPSEFAPIRAADQQQPLTGTVTIVMAEGRRLITLLRELPRQHFTPFINEYQRLISRAFGEMGGRQTELEGDAVFSSFATAREAVHGAIAAQRAVAAHEWPHGVKVAISVGMHSGEAGVGWVGPAIVRCAELCDAAEGGEIFLSQATASLLADQNLGELVVRDVGERQKRRARGAVRAYQLVSPAGGAATA